MGGEQWPVLVYGPKKARSMDYWLVRFHIMNAGESYYDYIMMEKLYEFLEIKGLIMVYFNNYNWEEFGIGLRVKDFDKLTKEERDTVKTFCEKYNLAKPTIYAGIVGEFE